MGLMFVYGTLKQGNCNNSILASSKFIGRAVTKESLNIKSVGVPIVVMPFTNAMRNTAKPIIGEVYEVPKRTVRIIDVLEGHPELYKRTMIDIELKGEIYKAYIYLFQQSNFLEGLDFGQEYANDSIIITEEGYKWVDIEYPYEYSTY